MAKTKKIARKNLKTKANKQKIFTKNKSIIIFVVLFAIIGAVLLFRSQAATPMWKPTADKPLRLTWILEDITNLTPEQVLNLQTKDLKGNPIPQGDVYDIDGDSATAAQVKYLQSKGKKVICYFDAGVYEDYRADASKFPKSVIGKTDEGWEGSYWLDIRQISILEPIMKARIQNCKDKGFDSVEPDEIVNYSNDSGFPLTYADQLKYNKAVASWAHQAGLSIGLKGDPEQAHDLVDDFDWTLNEECWGYNECTSIDDTGPGGPTKGGPWPSVTAFSKKNKAVWIAEYPLGDNGAGSDYYKKFRDKSTTSQLTAAKTNQICEGSKVNRFNTAFYISGLPVNSGRTDCPPFSSNPTGSTTPVVTITTAPSNLVAPANFAVTATSNIKSRIEIILNGNTLKSCTDTTTCKYDAVNYTGGEYQFSATSTTAYGDIGSNTISISVKNPTTTNKPPTITISSSGTNFTAPATYDISANPTDSDGSIVKVEFWANGKKVGESLTKPYVYKANKQSAGTYTYEAVAIDNQAASTKSKQQIIKVVEPTNQNNLAPTTPTGLNRSLDFDFSKFMYYINLKWNPSTDDSNLPVSYIISRDGAQIGNSTTPFYKDSNNLQSGVYYTYSVTAKDNTGLSSTPTTITAKANCFLIWCSLE